MTRKRAVFRTLYLLVIHSCKQEDKQKHRSSRFTLSYLLLILVVVLSQVAMEATPIFASSNKLIESAQYKASVQLEQGRKYYETGQFAFSAKVWQQAEQTATQGDPLKRAMILSNLSLAYQQLGQWDDAKRAIASCLSLLGYTGGTRAGGAGGAGGEIPIQNPKSKIQNLKVLAQALNTQGSLQLALGQSEQALSTWQQAGAIYDKAGDHTGIIRSLINQAQALRALGLYRRALTTLIQADEILQKQPDSQIKAASLRNLGITLQLIGNANQSRQVLQKSLVLAQKLKSPSDISAALLSLGNTARTQEDALAAKAFYEQAAITATDITLLQAQLNLLSLLLDQQQWTAAQALLPQIKSKIGNLSASRPTIYAQINFAQSLSKLGTRGWGLEARDEEGTRDLGLGARDEEGTRDLGLGTRESGKQGSKGDISISYSKSKIQNSPAPLLLASSPSPSSPQPLASSPSSSPQPLASSPSESPLYIAKLLATALNQARSLGDRQAEAYALGNLGKLYEQTGQLSIAQDLTEQALSLAQAINASDSAYNWQWQLGRLQKKRGDRIGAIASYTQAVKTLQSLRSDLVAVNSDVQFSFRESVEPVYRELVSLLLQQDFKPSQENLALARATIESLQLAELDNFFREACLDTKPVQLDSINAQSAVIYPIILADRLEVIISLPGQPLRQYTTSIPQNQVEDTINQLRQNLVIRSKRKFMPQATLVYDWLIRQAQADLAKSGIKTLVFVPDGVLRNIPMAALHDRQQYIIEKYSIALAPSLELLDPKPLLRSQLKALTVGLSEARPGFAPLSNVPRELEQIHSQVSGVVLLNQKFTSNAFEKQIQSSPFPIVHIATHGQFSSKAEETFILSWDNRINVKQLDNILQPKKLNRTGAIELLVLSACQTAVGDKRAALGLAGIAVRAGARSTLATLWSVDDAATAELMSQFYQELANSKVTKAEALRRAQLKLIKNPQQQHPIYWAAYVLVGNWL